MVGWLAQQFTFWGITFQNWMVIAIAIAARGADEAGLAVGEPESIRPPIRKSAPRRPQVVDGWQSVVSAFGLVPRRTARRRAPRPLSGSTAWPSCGSGRQIALGNVVRKPRTRWSGGRGRRTSCEVWSARSGWT